MKKIISLFAALFIAFAAFAQMQPVSWNATLEHAEGDTYIIQLKAVIIEESWHIYDLGPYAGGPNATSLSVELNGNATLVGEPYMTPQPKRVHDDIFDMEIGTAGDGVMVCQKIEATGANPGEIAVTIEWQACNDSNCIPPDDAEFKLQIPAKGGSATAATGASSGTTISAAPAETAQSADQNAGKPLMSLILSAILWGFAMLLTPCVFPMVPMTVSFFLKKNDGDGSSAGKGKFFAAAFGLFIVALYTVPIAVIILITWFAGGPAVTADIFNWLATHWLPNILFFAIFMIFAASFFGAFEITMPSSLVNSSDKKSDKGGLGGVFFLALTLVLVSFSCTGPIVGTVLIQSTSGGVWAPIITMMAFSIAFALPFTLFAFSPSLLSKLPKSGGWLNSVKVVLGFIEVALGFKFLSVADQTYHWGILDREVYLAIWIVVFAMLGFYLLGKLKFKFDSPLQHISVLRLTLAIVVFTFVVYMIPGMWG
ncbi:MAG: thiol:disulfide interchange protein, partial [Bacteroidales bacterium]|nr:thiol:disulfide interchange protein [Bacteroidales bacterium]